MHGERGGKGNDTGRERMAPPRHPLDITAPRLPQMVQNVTASRCHNCVTALPAGKYVLRLEGQWEKWQQPATVSVRVEQNVTRGFNFLVALILLSIGPVIMVIYHIGFERRRWSESMFGGGDSDHDE